NAVRPEARGGAPAAARPAAGGGPRRGPRPRPPRPGPRPAGLGRPPGAGGAGRAGPADRPVAAAGGPAGRADPLEEREPGTTVAGLPEAPPRRLLAELRPRQMARPDEAGRGAAVL